MVERGPEKAGVGGSIPSLATTPIEVLRLGRRGALAQDFACRLRRPQDGSSSIPSLAATFPIPQPLVRKGRARAVERSSVVSLAALRKAGVGGSIPSRATTLFHGFESEAALAQLSVARRLVPLTLHAVAASTCQGVGAGICCKSVILQPLALMPSWPIISSHCAILISQFHKRPPAAVGLACGPHKTSCLSELGIQVPEKAELTHDPNPQPLLNKQFAENIRGVAGVRVPRINAALGEAHGAAFRTDAAVIAASKARVQ